MKMLQSPVTRLLMDCLSLEEHLPGTGSVHPQDWQALASLARRHGLAPLLYWRLRADRVHWPAPDSVLRDLQEDYDRTFSQNLKIFQAIEQVLARLGQGQTLTIPLKGVFLTERIYHNLGLRPMSDIDLLLPQDQLSQAIQVLQELGYQPLYPFNLEQECRVRHALPTFNLPGQPGAPAFDLHWTLAPPDSPFQIPIQSIWERARPGLMMDQPVLELSPEDLLLHLSLHAAYMEYFCSGMRPFYDIACSASLYKDQIDWPRLIHQAHQWRAARSTWLALLLSVCFFQAPIPAVVLAGLDPNPEDSIYLDWAAAQILEPAGLGGKLAAVWASPTWPQRLLQAIRLVFPSLPEMRAAYPHLARSLFWPLAYSSHLARVIQRNWRSAWGLARRQPTLQADALQRQRVNQLVAWQANPAQFNQPVEEESS
jgi:hypothetical protein